MVIFKNACLMLLSASSDLQLFFGESPQFSAWFRRFYLCDLWPFQSHLCAPKTLFSVFLKNLTVLPASWPCSDIPFACSCLLIFHFLGCQQSFKSSHLHHTFAPKPRQARPLPRLLFILVMVTNIISTIC